MGDECNVASRQSDDSSSSSSPILGPRIKNLEECHVGDTPHQETDFLLLSKQSGEPDEEIYKISGNKHLAEKKISQLEESAISEPLLFVPPSLAKTTISAFPYFETKLRPDAPPFTPESLAQVGPATCGIVEISDAVDLEANFIPRTVIDESCFENIELRSSVDVTNASSIADDTKNESVTEKRSRDFPAITKEPDLKMINVTSTPRLKRSSPNASIDSLSVNLRIDESIVVAKESILNQPENGEIRPETAEPQVTRGRWRILRTTCIRSNRIQIVVFIASLVICMILVIYVVL